MLPNLRPRLEITPRWSSELTNSDYRHSIVLKRIEGSYPCIVLQSQAAIHEAVAVLHHASSEHSEAPLVPPHPAAKDSPCTLPPANTNTFSLLSMPSNIADHITGWKTCWGAAVEHTHSNLVRLSPVLNSI